MTLDKLLHFCASASADIIFYILHRVVMADYIIYVKYLKQYLAHGMGYINVSYFVIWGY